MTGYIIGHNIDEHLENDKLKAGMLQIIPALGITIVFQYGGSSSMFGGIGLSSYSSYCSSISIFINKDILFFLNMYIKISIICNFFSIAYYCKLNKCHIKL